MVAGNARPKNIPQSRRRRKLDLQMPAAASAPPRAVTSPAGGGDAKGPGRRLPARALRASLR